MAPFQPQSLTNTEFNGTYCETIGVVVHSSRKANRHIIPVCQIVPARALGYSHNSGSFCTKVLDLGS